MTNNENVNTENGAARSNNNDGELRSSDLLLEDDENYEDSVFTLNEDAEKGNRCLSTLITLAKT